MKETINRVVEVIGTPIVCLITRLLLKRVEREIRKVKDGSCPMSELVEIATMLESDYLPDFKKYWYTCHLEWTNKACLHHMMKVYKTIFKIDCLFHSFRMADF